VCIWRVPSIHELSNLIKKKWDTNRWESIQYFFVNIVLEKYKNINLKKHIISCFSFVNELEQFLFYFLLSTWAACGEVTIIESYSSEVE